MASQFDEISLRIPCSAFRQLNFIFPQRVHSLVGKSSAYYARESNENSSKLFVETSSSEESSVSASLLSAENTKPLEDWVTFIETF
ncbi:hypothetical protein TNCV_3410341 [Trichonephila clavipes]|nr:hypothetical protein TNCV_3410341 [Trichonephila clavipes]